MREYKLKIKGGSDFVIVSPKVIAALVKEIYNTPQKELSVAVEKIMPEDFTQYLMRVINSNRYTNDQFQFRKILEDPITNQHIYQILQEQLGEMRMDDNSCFEYFELESVDGEAGINMECSEPFFWACKDCAARFVYMFPGGGQERIIVEYPKEK